ncbi:YaiO family outer membrane beta-barrel protein [Lysobacter pythonis]|uniref:YaiO family outer membrane beta-barrel protein n=1 Tax=Solilutibacter pythonis TaxID=2483112 RepID=A0A3M2HF56_9GAMM|nr:YaiO family outer membrane beta-barrel protein [Lysobacter pythonis]RMH88376.1 YaiO family outer membrane beta-barrel protein [Lysobacter pythonis]
MTKRTPALALSATILALATTHSIAAEQTFSLNVEYTDLEALGERSVLSADYVLKKEKNTFVFNIAGGDRSFPQGTDAKASKAGITVYTKWNDVVTTRFGGSVASDKPVFAKRDLYGNVDLNFIPNTSLSFGARDTRYFGNVGVTSWNAGATYYFPRGSLMYRFTRYKTDITGSKNGHTARLTIKDGASSKGRTELWLGKGNRAFAYDWATEFLAGSTKSATLRRVQPVSENLALNATLGRTWYKMPFTQYTGTTLGLGIEYNW